MPETATQSTATTDQPSWDDTQAVEPTWDETYELTAAPAQPAKKLNQWGLEDIPLKFPAGLDPKYRYQLPAGMSMGPFGPIDPAEGARVFTEIPGAIAKAGEEITQPIADMATDWLHRTGIDPSAQPDKPLLDLTPRTPPSPDEGFIRSGLRRGSEIASSFTTPRQAFMLPFLPFKAVQAMFGVQAAASLPESIQEIARAKTPGETGAALTGFGANLTMAGLMGRQLARKAEYARSLKEAAKEDGDLRTPPGEGPGQVPAEEGGGGIQPSTEGQEAEVLLRPALENNRSLGLGHQVKYHDTFEGPGSENQTAYADPPVVDEYGDFVRPGAIHVNRQALATWLKDIPKEQHAQAIKALMSEEGIHSMITDAEADAYSKTLTAAERSAGMRNYLGEQTPESIGGLKPNQLAHELLRQRMQQLLRMSPTEIADAVRTQKWSRQSVFFLMNLIRGFRELIGTKAAKAGGEMTERLLDRFEENIGEAGAEANFEVPEYKPTGDEPFSIRRAGNVDDDLERLAGLSTADWMKEIPNTNAAWGLGMSLRTPEQVEALGRQETEVRTRIKELQKEGRTQDAFQELFRAQFLREAREAATGTGSAGFSLRKNPEYQPPVPMDEAAARPKGIRRKDDKQKEFLLPNVSHGTSKEVQPMPGEPTAAKPATLPQVPPGVPEEVAGGAGVRKGELPLSSVPKGGYVERNRPAPSPEQFNRAVSAQFDREIAAGKAPDFDEFKGELEGQFGALSHEKVFNAYQNAWNDRLMKAPAAELDKIIDDLNLRGKLQAEHQQTFAPGTIAEAVEIPKEHQAQFEALARQFPHNKISTPRAVRQFFSQALRRRYMAIGAILDKVTKDANPPAKKSLDRAEIGPEEIASLAGERLFRAFTGEEAASPEKVGEIATRGAAMDATGKGAPPRTVSKNVIALRDASGQIKLVSAWKDPRTGAKVTNPADPKAPSRKIDNDLLKDYRPVAVMTIKEPVKGFYRVFGDANAFYKWFGDAGVPGTRGLRTSMFTGPHADIANIAQGRLPGRAPAPAAAPTGREFLQAVLPEGLSEYTRELQTPGRAPIPTQKPLYRAPRPGAEPAEKLPLNERLAAAARAADLHPYEPTQFEPSPELEKRGVSIMPGARGERPAGIKRGGDDFLKEFIDRYGWALRQLNALWPKVASYPGIGEVQKLTSEKASELPDDVYSFWKLSRFVNELQSMPEFKDYQKLFGKHGEGKPLIGPGLEPRGIIRSTKAAARVAADELENLKSMMMTATKRGAINHLLSVGRDVADNNATMTGREAGTGVRIASIVVPPGLRGKPVKEWPAALWNRYVKDWQHGDPDRLAAANALVESGFNQSKLADFKQMVANGRQQAEVLENSPRWRERRVGRAWLRSLDQADHELDYADQNWHDQTLQDTAQRMKRELDEAYRRERAAKINLRKDPTYLPHRYVTLTRPGILGRRYALPQVFETYYDALQNGPFLAATRDGASLVEHRVTQGMRRIQQAAWEQALKGIQIAGRPLSIDTIRVRGDDVSPDPDYTVVKQHSGKNLAIMNTKEYPIAKMVRNLVGHSPLEDWALTRNALHLSQKLKHTLLVGDFFHLARVLYYATSIMGKNAGWKGGWSVLDIGERDVSEAVRKGVIRQADADWGREQVDITEPGGPHQTTSRRNLAKRFYGEMGLNLGKIQDALYKDLISKYDPRSGAIARGLTRALDPSVGRYNRFLFDKLTRGLMAESAVREFERQHTARPDLSADALMRDIARDVNTYYGNLGRQGFLKARWQQDLARIFWLAPQWVEGLVRKEATAYSRWLGASQLLGRKVAGAPKYQQTASGRMALQPAEGLTRAGTTGRGIARGLGFMFGLTQVINYMTRGQATFQNPEKGHELDAWIPGWGHDGKGFWLSPLAVFNELSHDLFRLVASKPKAWDAIRQIIGNKESPLVRAALVGLTGTGPTGEIETTTGGVIGTAAEQLMPLPITFGRYGQALGHAIAPSLVRPVGQAPMERQLFGTVGIKVEPEQSPSQRMTELAKDFMQSEGLTKSTGWQEVMTDEPSYAKLRNALRNDDPHGAEKIMQGLLKHNHTEEEVAKAMRDWSKRGFTGSQKTERDFLSSLTDEQMEEYSKAEDRKMELYEKFLDWYLNRP
jgi:hypothetical protein